MDLNNEVGLNTEQSASAQFPIAIAPAPAGDSPLDAREAARSLAAWRRDRDQQPNISNDQPQLRARAERAAPHEPRRNRVPAQVGSDAGERPAPPARPRVPIRQPNPARRRGRTCRPSSRPGLGRRKTRTSSRASLARRRSESAERERSREGDFNRRQQEAAEKRKALRPNARRRSRQGNSTRPHCRSFSRRCSSNRRASSPISKPWRTSNAWPAKTGPATPDGTCSKRKLPRSGNISRWHSSGKPRSACSSSRNSPGARTISSRRKSLTWRTPREPQAAADRGARGAQGPAASRKRSWRNRGTARGTCPCVTIACSS